MFEIWQGMAKIRRIVRKVFPETAGVRQEVGFLLGSFIATHIVKLEDLARLSPHAFSDVRN